MKPLWGIDLGGTKIEGVIIQSQENPQELARLRIPTEASKGYSHILQQIHKLVKELENESGLTPDSVGIGTHGELEPSTGTMKNCNTTALNVKPQRTDQETMNGFPSTMASDAQCLSVA